jgi:hypothetical protein
MLISLLNNRVIKVGIERNEFYTHIYIANNDNSLFI